MRNPVEFRATKRFCWLASVFFALVFSACTDKKPQKRPDIISSHTTGVISVKSPVRVHFQFPLINMDDVGKNGPDKLIEISPKTKGKAIWLSQHALEFVPESHFEPDREFRVKVNFQAVSDSIKKAYEFTFRTLRPSLEVAISRIESVDFNGKPGYTVQGNVSATDYVPFEDVQNLIEAKLDRRNIKPSYQAHSGQKYTFMLDSIDRTSNPQTLLISFNGSDLKAQENGEFNFRIPPINEFGIISHSVVYEPEAAIILNFSDILQPNQDLTGMIQLEKTPQLQTLIDKNILKIYPHLTSQGELKLNLFRGIRSIDGSTLPNDALIQLNLVHLQPELRKTSNKVVSSPTQQGSLFEFEAARLHSVDVRIFQVFENNVIQFLQINDFQGNWELERVGKLVYQSTVSLEGQAESSHEGWNKYYLDLSKMVQSEKGALYHIQVGFRKQHTVWDCSEEESESVQTNLNDYWDRFEDYSYGEYSWDYSNNPCNDNFYGFRKALRHNYLSSNIGLIAKKDGKNRLSVFATIIDQNKPMADCIITVLNYQQQKLAEGTTNKDGMATFPDMEDSYFVLAQWKEDRNYLKLPPHESLTVSNFDVEGVETRDGIKAFAFSERDVYRPGDTVFIGFIINDPQNTIPTTHPIQVYVTNANGQPAFETRLQYKGEPMHRIDIPTKSDALTGSWTARMTIGKREFYKRFRVETIRPNRMEIIHDIPEVINSQGTNASILVKWLHGGSAANQEFDVDAVAKAYDMQFKTLPGFTFANPYIEEYPQEWNVLTTKLDSEGKTRFPVQLSKGLKSAAYRLTFSFRATEPGGQFTSTSAHTIVSPFTNLTGLKLPEPDGQWGQYQSKKKYTGELVLVDMTGKVPDKSQRISITIYKRNWQWWYQSSIRDYDYMTGTTSSAVFSYIVNVQNGRGSFDFSIDDNWGYYQVIARNTNTGQEVSDMIRVGNDGYSGAGASQDVATIDLTLDKNEYSVGDDITLTFPSSKGGMALVSTESGREIVRSEWVETTDNYTTYVIKATTDMSPNVYFNVTFLQPFENTTNDRPLRLYGIVPCKVTDPETKLNPVLEAPDKVNCNEPFTIKISERNDKDMKYMLAIVDEGLLGITSYKTPAPWEYFHRQEALGVTTWDLFDWVMGAMSGVVGRVIGVGGDYGDMGSGPSSLNTQFKAVVSVLGPFTLKGNSSGIHEIKLPAFLGAVRVMAISTTIKSWGAADKRVTVSSPLLLTASTPRLLTPGDRFDLPVTLFGSEETQRRIQLKVKEAKNLVLNQNTLEINLDNNFRGYSTLSCQVKQEIGQATLILEATDNKHTSTYEIQIPVENPTPTLVEVGHRSLEPKAEWKTGINAIGVKGTNKAALELSNIPPIDLEKHLEYLLNYPYGCLEQTSSTGFPLLYIETITDLDEERKTTLTKIVTETINRIYGFQDATGVFNYWQGTANYYEWADIYAGDFLVEAGKKGHKVDEKVLNRWIAVQKKNASRWVDNGALSRVNQAYRLFVLARAGQADIGAMNRLRNSKQTEEATNQLLALAYAENGRDKTALELLNAPSDKHNNDTWNYTFGSPIRDMAIRLMAYTQTGNLTGAFDLLVIVSEEISKSSWNSTQTLGFLLRSVGTYIGKSGYSETIEAKYSLNNGKEVTVKSNKPFVRIEVPMQFTVNQPLSIQNISKSVLFARLINTGKPMPSAIKAENNTITIRSQFYSSDNNPIDISNLKQGEDLVSEISVENPPSGLSLENLALEFTVPSGMEVINPRLSGLDESFNESSFTYRDYRDNKAFTFFDLHPGERKTFKFRVNATFSGEFYFPPITCSQMYNALVTARTESKTIKINK